MNKFILLILILFATTSCNISSPGTGSKIGRIVRLEDSGLINTTTQGEIIRGSMNDGSGSFGGSLYFTIEDPVLKKVAFEAFQKQQEVIIYYRTEFISSPFRAECGCFQFVTHIEIVK